MRLQLAIASAIAICVFFLFSTYAAGTVKTPTGKLVGVACLKETKLPSTVSNLCTKICKSSP